MFERIQTTGQIDGPGQIDGLDGPDGLDGVDRLDRADALDGVEKSRAAGNAAWTATPPPCCSVCGSRKVDRDAVEQDGWLWLAECRHCDHRWTQRGPEPVAAPAQGPARVQPVRVAGEVASAA